MYALVKNKTVLKFPYSFSDLRKDNPATSFPSSFSDKELESWGVVLVGEKEPPEYNAATEALQQIDPVLVDGSWTQAWIVTQISPEEAERRLVGRSLQVRQQRNELLGASDWTQLADARVDVAAWAVYRQELRDITVQAGFPWNVTWPVAPEV